LYEFGEICDAKMFWDILEIKYNMKRSEKDQVDEGVVKNGDCAENIKNESMSVVDLSSKNDLARSV